MNLKQTITTTMTYFHGRIDEVRLYHQALSTEEVLAIATAPGPNRD